MQLKDLIENIDSLNNNKLFEGIRQYDLEETIIDLRNNHMFYAERSLRGPLAFEEGFCFEFSLALFNFLKSKGEQPELMFLVGNMKKAEAAWYDIEKFNPVIEHPFHAVIKLRKFYFDINGKLGTKREIVARWTKFRRKKMVGVTVEEMNPYIKDRKLVADLEIMFGLHYDNIRQWR